MVSYVKENCLDVLTQCDVWAEVRMILFVVRLLLMVGSAEHPCVWRIKRSDMF